MLEYTKNKVKNETLWCSFYEVSIHDGVGPAFCAITTLVYVTSDLCSERKLNKPVCLTTLDFGEIIDLGLSLEHTQDD